MTVATPIPITPIGRPVGPLMYPVHVFCEPRADSDYKKRYVEDWVYRRKNHLADPKGQTWAIPPSDTKLAGRQCHICQTLFSPGDELTLAQEPTGWDRDAYKSAPMPRTADMNAAQQGSALGKILALVEDQARRLTEIENHLMTARAVARELAGENAPPVAKHTMDTNVGRVHR